MCVLLESLMNTCIVQCHQSAGGHDKQDAKARVAVIHTIKDQLKQQNELVKQLKRDLKEIQDKIKAEKEVTKSTKQWLQVYHLVW